MFRPLACRQLLSRVGNTQRISKSAYILPQDTTRGVLFQPCRELATNTVKIDKSSSKKKKYKKRGDKSKPPPQQSPDVAKEREIREMQQKVRWYHNHGSYDEALTAAQELLATSEEHFGKDHPATASAYNNVGLFHKLLGNFKEAKQYYHDALRSYGYILGKDHASYAAALHNLATLLKSQVTLDESLTAMERLQQTEEAIQHLEEAYAIRQVELGQEHPHTVASQSLLGSTIASQLLALQSQQSQQSNEKSEWKPSKMTLQRWEMAEQHLRQALEIAIQNPRGNRIEIDTDTTTNITTLSAASAGQNLAIVLKTRATLSTPVDTELLQEARKLYEQALHVRSTLLHEAHPDAVATKYSLAELLETSGDVDTANKLRQEIMDSYNITEVNDDDDESESDARNNGNNGDSSHKQE